ncbi:MAG TPA: DMT family transporter [Acidothermaceae bacterium]
MTAVLALLASLVWGCSDFVGGLVSRRVRPLVVVGAAHVIGLSALLVLAAATGEFSAGLGYLPWAVAAGGSGLVGLVAFYRALSIGTMGIVAPIAGTGAVVPVAVGLATGDSPSALQLAGIAVACVGVVLASGPEISGGDPAGRRPLILALVAAVGFGLVYVFIDGGSQHSVVMTLVLMRATSVTLVLCVGIFLLLKGFRPRGAAAPSRGELLAIGFVGLTDLAANGLYGLATRHGLVSVVSVLASLYPAVTVLLARVIERERMRRIQGVGVLFALFGVVLLGAG